MKFCVLIPVFNGEKTIKPVIEEIKNFTGNIIVVNDGSLDNTLQILEKLSLRIISHPVNKGKGMSLRTGFDYVVKETSFDYVLVLDADGQHDPKFIPQFLETAQKSDFDIIIGNRMHNLSAMPLIRQLTNKAMSFLISKIARQNIPDSQCGYRLIKRKVIEKIELKSSNFETESEILIKASEEKFKIGSLEISTIYTGQKSSINSIVDTLRFFKMLFKCLMNL